EKARHSILAGAVRDTHLLDGDCAGSGWEQGRHSQEESQIKIKHAATRRGRVTCRTRPSSGYGSLRGLASNFKVIHDLLNVFHTTRDLLRQIFFLLGRTCAGAKHSLVDGIDAYLGQRLQSIL